jgi:hypothetical protein
MKQPMWHSESKGHLRCSALFAGHLCHALLDLFSGQDPIWVAMYQLLPHTSLTALDRSP